MALSNEKRADLIELCAEMAVCAGELFGALLAVQVPDHAGRGTKNFDHHQAFDLTKTILVAVLDEQ